MALVAAMSIVLPRQRTGLPVQLHWKTSSLALTGEGQVVDAFGTTSPRLPT